MMRAARNTRVCVRRDQKRWQRAEGGQRPTDRFPWTLVTTSLLVDPVSLLCIGKRGSSSRRADGPMTKEREVTSRRLEDERERYCERQVSSSTEPTHTARYFGSCRQSQLQHTRGNKKQKEQRNKNNKCTNLGSGEEGCWNRASGEGMASETVAMIVTIIK